MLLTRLHCGHGFWFAVMEQFWLRTALAWLGLLRPVLTWVLSCTGVETAVRVRDDTPCTSKDNKWLMPTPTQSIPYLPLSEIDFSALKRQKLKQASALSFTVHNVTSSSLAEKEDFFHEIAEEQEKKPLILSVIEPYSERFVFSCDHLPKLLHGIIKPEYLDSNYTQLLTLAESYLQ